MTPKTWFITGASRGFGREWAIAALDRGDSVAATARDTAPSTTWPSKYGELLLPIKLDVTDRAADFAAVQQAHDHFGRLDVVVNNAGYGQFGMIEELSEAEARDQIETNLFGALWVTQAALPFLRAQGSGHIIQVSSIGGITAFPDVGIYHASKWALEGFSAGARAGGAGVRHPRHADRAGRLRDRLGRPLGQARRAARGLRRLAAAGKAWRAHRNPTPGDPKASAAAILRVVDAEQPPLRVFFGTAPLQIAEADYASRLETWRAWQDVAELAQG